MNTANFWLSVWDAFLALGFGFAMLLWAGTLNPKSKRKDPLWLRWGFTLLSLTGMLFFGERAFVVAFSGW